MKKAIRFILSIIIILTNLFIVSYAENITGLNEQIDEIWFEVSEDVYENMQKTYEEYTQKTIKQYLMAPDYAREQVGLSTDDTELEKQIRDSRMLDYNYILVIYPYVTQKYVKQYVEEGVPDYLISDKYYLSVLEKSSGYFETFDSAGTYLDGNFNDLDDVIYDSMVLAKQGYEFLNDSNKINGLLQSNSVKNVNDVQVLILDNNYTLLELSCDNGTYIIQIYSGIRNLLDDDIELFKLYPFDDYMNKIKRLKSVDQTKPTYETEAESLQSRGLLHGNENGLDLLKPLTRIEAAAMLLRALSQSETAPNGNSQTFVDVPKEHWGYGAAENAYYLGLIKGIGESLFAPDEPVTAPQFATMVLRAGNHPDFNWEEALNILIEENIISAEDTTTMDFFTRGDMAKIIYEAIEKGMF